MKKIIGYIATIQIYLGLILIVSPIVISTLQFSNKVYSSKNNERNSTQEVYASTNESDVLLSTFENYDTKNLEEDDDIQVDEELRNYGNKIEINSIGVNTYIWESTDGKRALDLGVWRLPTKGIPGEDDPMVLSAHRWGSLEIDREFRNKNLFYNLPSVMPGDEVTIYWNDAIYSYRISEIYDATYVSKTDDLVLVTCRDLDAEVKVIALATLTNIEFTN